MNTHSGRIVPFRAVLSLLAIAASALGSVTTARATTFTVGCPSGVGDVSTFIAAVNSANSGSGDTIQLNAASVANCVYNLTTIDNYWYGPNGLPPITSSMTINGNGATIQRSGITNFRFFYVSGGLSGLTAGNLTLQNVTLSNGVAQGGGSGLGGGGAGMGGAIFNQGTLSLSSVTMTGNAARGGNISSTNPFNFQGGGGMGEDAQGRNGGGFGGSFSAIGATLGGLGSVHAGGAGGGGGFVVNGTSSIETALGAAGGGNSGWGGTGSNSYNEDIGGAAGDGGGGGASAAYCGPSCITTDHGSNGGNFGQGGFGNSLADLGNGGGGVGGGGGGADGFGGPGGGGFGGGGGSVNTGGAGFGATGGMGGFGGGGGSGVGNATEVGGGGYGGGASSSSLIADGFSTTYGGGGAGMGGAIFNLNGTLSLVSCTLTSNSAQGGTIPASPKGNTKGAGLGGAIFNLQGTVTITQSTLTTNTVVNGNSVIGPAGSAVYNVGYLAGDNGGILNHLSLINIIDSTLSDIANDQPVTLINGAANIATAIINTPPAITSNGGAQNASISIAENTTGQTTITATDTDIPAQTFTYSLSGVDANKFTIGSSTGILVFTSPPDYETPTDSGNNNVYDVTVQVSDGFLTASQTLAVTVTNDNEAPIITSNGGGLSASINVPENTTAATTVVATDADASTTLTYSISGGDDAGQFTITPSSGALTFLTAPDFEIPTDTGTNNIYDVIVQVSDGILTDSQTLAITVSNVNETPVITSNGGGATASINMIEGNTAVTTVAATDVDASTTLTFSITGGADSAKFAIGDTSGVLTFVTAPDFLPAGDANSDNIYDVIVQVSDGTLTDSQTLAVAVAYQGAPIITSNGGGTTASMDVPENTTAVTTVVATDLDSITLTYSLSGGADSARFTIDNNSGVLDFISAPNFESPTDANGDNIYQVIAQVTDGVFTDSQTLSITITNFNEVPVITSNGGGATASINVVEDGTNVTTVIATDVDAPTTFTFSITGGVDSAKFSIDNSTGVLTFQNAPDFENPTDVGSNNVYDVIVQVSDGTLTDSQALAVTVTYLNVAAVIGNLNGDTTFPIALGSPLPIDLRQDTTVIDVASLNFNTGTLQVVQASGTANGSFSVDGVTVMSNGDTTIAAGETIQVGGISMATIDATDTGQNGLSLTINFTANATPTLTQQLLQNLKFTAPTAGVRGFTITLNDGNGGFTPVTVTANVRPDDTILIDGFD